MWPFKPNISRLTNKCDIDGLIRALAYKRDARTRAFAARALRDLGTAAEAAGPALTAALQDMDSVEWEVIGPVPVCAEAAAALVKIRHAPAVWPLIQQLQHADVRARRNAAEALGFQGNRAATKPLVGALKDARIVVRHAAVVALNTLADPESCEGLIELLGTHSTAGGEEIADVHCLAVDGLGKLRDARAVNALIDLLSAPHLGLRISAVGALGVIGDARATHALSIIALDGRADSDIVRRAKDAIAQINAAQSSVS
jgi:HEAT repeat protein